MINFAFLYSENPSQVKDFFAKLESIIESVSITNLNFLNLVDKNGNSLLHNVVSNKDLHMMQTIFKLIKSLELKQKSEFINLQNNNGDTAFHLAALSCERSLDNNVLCDAIAKLLEEEGANKNIPNKQGMVVSASPNNNVNKNITVADVSKRNNLNNISTEVSKKNNLNNIPTEVSVDNLVNRASVNKVPVNNSVNKIRVIDNIPTEVSVDNVKKNQLLSLTDLSSEVSIDNNRSLIGGTESSTSDVSDNSKSSSHSDSSKSSKSSTSESNTSTSGGSSDFTESVYKTSDSSNKSRMHGGGINSESSGLSDTSAFVKTLLTQFNSMKGGSRAVRGDRKLPSLSEYELNEIYGGKDYGLSREQMKESSNIHDNVVKMFIDNGKSEEEARIMKMALYKYTKDKHPELNNLDRAKKMREYADDSSILKKIDLDSTRKLYEEVKKSKNMMTDSSDKTKETSEMETDEKPKKKTTKKTTKEKKVSKKTKK
jgi:hypothetical protein